MATKTKLKNKSVLSAPTPTYTKIDPTLNRTYAPPTPQRQSNIVVTQQDLMPVQTQPQARQPIKSKGVLSASSQPKVEQEIPSYMQSQNPFLMNRLTPNVEFHEPVSFAQPQPAMTKPVQTMPSPQEIADATKNRLFPQRTHQTTGYVAPTKEAAEQFIKAGATPEMSLQARKEQWFNEQKKKRQRATIGKDPNSLVAVTNKYGEILPQAINALELAIPGVAEFERGANEMMGFDTHNLPPGSNGIGGKIAKGIGSIAAGSINPAALEQSLITTPYKAAGALMGTKAAQSVLGKIESLNPMLANYGIHATPQVINRAATGALAGAGTGALMPLLQGDPSAKDIAKSAAIGGALGGVADVVMPALGNLAKTAISKLRSKNIPEEAIARITQLPENEIVRISELSPDEINAVLRDANIPETPVITRNQPEFQPETYLPEERLGRFSESTTPAPAPTREPFPVSARIKSKGVLGEPPIIQRGERPAVPEGERRLYSNYENTELSPELRRELSMSERRGYRQISNPESLGKANRMIDEQGLDEAISYTRSGEGVDADQAATAIVAINRLQQQGRNKEAARLIDELAEKATKAGQFNQALSMIQRLSPEGQLLRIKRIVKDINKKLPTNKQIKLTTEQEENILEVAKTAKTAGLSQDTANEVLAISEKSLRGELLTAEEQGILRNFQDDLQAFLDNKQPDLSPSRPIDTSTPAGRRKRDAIVDWVTKHEQSAQARMNARRNTLSANPFDVYVDMGIIAASKMLRKSVKFADFSSEMIQEFGDSVKPYLKRAFDQGKRIMNRNITITTERAAEGVAAISKEARKQTVEEMVYNTQRSIEKMKRGEIDNDDIEALHNAANNLNAILKNPKATTEEKQLAQLSSQIARKMKQAEDVTKPKTPESVKEMQKLLRKITGIKDETKKIDPQTGEPIDYKHIDELAYKIFDRAVPGTAEKMAQKFLRSTPSLSQAEVKKIRDLAQSVSRLKGAEKAEADLELQKIINGFEQSDWLDRANALRYIGMLLNTGTQLVNALSGPLMASTYRIGQLAATMADVMMAGVLKQPRRMTAYQSNPLTWMGQYFKNLRFGVRASWQGVNPAGLTGPRDVGGLVFKGKNIASIVPHYLERSLSAVAKGADYATYKTVYDRELLRRGFINAKNQGIQGTANQKRFAENFAANPDQAAMEYADDQARRVTFQRNKSTGAKLANAIHTLPAIAKAPIQTVAPFVKTPINIASTAVDLTPVGLLRGLFELSFVKDEAVKANALSRMGLSLIGGGGLSAIGYELSRAGILTGSNESGFKDVDKIREQAGRGKYLLNTSALMRYIGALFNGEDPYKAAAFQKGDVQMNYNKFQPLAFPMAIGVGLEQRRSEGLGSMLKGAGTEAAGSLLGMSALTGIQQAVQSYQDKTSGDKSVGFIQRVAEMFAKSFSPSFLAQEARREDKTVRKTAYGEGFVKDVLDYYKSRTPSFGGLIPEKYTSKALPAAMTTLGQEKQHAGGFVGSYLNPYQMNKAQYSEAAVTIANLIDRTNDEKLAPKTPNKKIEGTTKSGEYKSIELTGKEYEQYQRDIGNEIVSQINALPASMSDADKAEKIKDIYEKVNTKYRNKKKKEYGIKVSQ